MTEFTGERVIPGKVNVDLWAEHVSRYAFASRLTAGKRVLDVGCGTGYGTAELAQNSALTVGIDLAREAVEYGSINFPSAQFLQCSASELPFTAQSFDTVIAFEVIEHLSDWNHMLTEVSRVLRHDGLLIVSTPNKLYYAETRGTAGPNPYHHHEFEIAEFRAALANVFPHVTIFLQDRMEAFGFYTPGPPSSIDGYLARASEDPTCANFFVAVCSRAPIPNLPAFIYVPEAANLLAERERHIRLLEGELTQVHHWLRTTMAERDGLLDRNGALEGHLAGQNRWALETDAKWKASQERVTQLQEDYRAEQERATAALADLNSENLAKTNWAQQLQITLTAAQRRIAQLQEDFAAEQKNAVSAIDRLNAENLSKTNWALDTSRRLVETEAMLRASEAAIVERTELTQRLELSAANLRADLQRCLQQFEMMRQSRWIRLGRLFGVGPNLQQPREHP